MVALQEVRGDLKALRHTMKPLGPDWGFVLTDVTRGGPGNDERLGFVFDRRTIRISGLAGELVVPDAAFDRTDPGALDRQFARTPYAVAFECGGTTFVLVTLHVLWGDRPDERTPGVRAIAEWLDEWARDVNAWNHNLIALDDFNIDRRGDERYDAFVSTGLSVPADSTPSRGRSSPIRASPASTSTTRSRGSRASPASSPSRSTTSAAARWSSWTWRSRAGT